MMLGVVNGRLEAVIRVAVLGPRGATITLDAVIDSGFTGMLSLPSATIARLGLVGRSALSHRLVDGSLRLFDLDQAKVFWDGIRREVAVLEAEISPLVSMTLLEGFSLQVEVRPGGSVQIMPSLPEGDASGETLMI